MSESATEETVKRNLSHKEQISRWQAGRRGTTMDGCPLCRLSDERDAALKLLEKALEAMDEALAESRHGPTANWTWIEDKLDTAPYRSQLGGTARADLGEERTDG